MLWKKVMPRLSAGRVQSVATRLVVERERERMRVRRGRLLGHPRHVRARRVRGAPLAVDGKRVAQGRDFGRGRDAASAAVLVLDEDAARSLADALDGRPFTVEKVDEKPYTRRPAAPFRTSTLQQEASRKLRFSSQTTMRVAQRLYENGHITYMRTDSVTLSESALDGGARARRARLRAGDRARRAAPLRAGGRERAGGARGDPARRRRLPDAGRAPRRALARRARALRPHLQADGRLADEGRERPDGLDRARRDGRRRRATRRSARAAPSSRSPASSRPTSRAATSRRTTTRSGGCRRSTVGQTLAGVGARAAGPRDEPARRATPRRAS